VKLDDYDNNTGIFTRHDYSISFGDLEILGGNTNPDDFDNLFKVWPTLLNKYDLIMIKSCYPNSHIKSREQLEEIEAHYLSIFKSFVSHKKDLLILTSPPLRPLFTNSNEAALSSELADWLVKNAPKHVKVFDLHHKLSEENGRHKGMLKRKFRRFALWDNHPNRKANKIITPKICELVE